MADQHNSNIPAVGNQIANDIPDMKENMEFHKDVFQSFVNSWSDTTATGITPAKLARKAISNTDSPYSHAAADVIIEVDASGGAVEIDLLAAATAGAGRILIIKLIDATNTLTIDPNGSETIDGSSTSLILTMKYETIMLYCDGSNWYVVAKYKPGLKRKAITNSDTPYTALLEDRIIEVDASGGTVTVNLPAAATAGKGHTISFKITDATNAVTLDGNASETIEGSTTYVMNSTNASITIYSDGSNWRIIGSVAARIYTGTYTGNGTTGQAITGIGFSPKFLHIFVHPAAAANEHDYIKLDQTWEDYAKQGWHDLSSVNNINSLDSDGFTVDAAGTDAHPNKNSETYDYIALG